MYALSGALAARAEDSKMDNILKVIRKLPGEFQVVAIKDSVKRNRDIIKHAAVSKWTADNANVIL